VAVGGGLGSAAGGAWRCVGPQHAETLGKPASVRHLRGQ
jgi:hypothetical protein